MLLLLLQSTLLLAQDESHYKKLYNQAQKYFDNEEFDKALPLFLKLDSLKPDNFEIKYNIGACYLNTKYQKQKGIPYIEYAIEKGKNLIPMAAFKDLGTLYHLNYEFDKAKEQFKRYLKLAYKDEEGNEEVKRMITICDNAIEILKDTIEYEIFRIDSPVNTMHSELTPFVSADNSILYFTRAYKKFNGIVYCDSIKEILYSKKKNGKWQDIKVIVISDEIKGKFQDISLAGISPSGEEVFLQAVDKSNNSDLYVCYISNDTINKLQKLGNEINTRYWEGSMSITADGTDLYFSSDRPGGYGGKDIYKITRNEAGEWGKPVNLGPVINTNFDEDAPYIHPDKRTLFFSSNGHKTIGGSDIFRSFYNSSKTGWSKPENMKYPINSTYDDKSFILSADGSSGYFSSTQANNKGLHDIYLVNFYKTIPLTLVKGKILKGRPPVPASANIKVYDKELNERVKYIYNPNPYTGEYLMIFPPGKNYDIYIESPGFKPHIISIYVPNQTYFYELYQEIHLMPLYIDSNIQIGEEINVKNMFYDIYHNDISDSIYVANNANPEKNYDHLLNLIEEMIETTDSIGLYKLDFYSQMSNKGDTVKDQNYNKLLNIINDALETSDSVALEVLDYNTKYAKHVNKAYFYNNNDTGQLVQYVLGGDTIYSLPKLITSEAIASKDIAALLEDSAHYQMEKKYKKKYIYKTEIFFNSNTFKIDSMFFNKIDAVAGILKAYDNVNVEVNGYTDTSGPPKYNEKLSEKRALSVLKLLEKNCKCSFNYILHGYGESMAKTEKSEEDKAYNRRVELLLFVFENE
ncbi:MAG: hypothetical protein Kow0068_06250 [Marinilabiliales bacterium]